MSLTEQQQRAVCSRGKVIVSASAGSGKTHVMIERFISILRGGEAGVKEILAVTFTNKAAAQMRERARKKLAEAYRASSGEERSRLKRQLEDLPLADISTIHSFCGRLVRTYFYLVGVDPRFRILDGEQAEGRAISARALELAFDRAYEEGEAWFSDLLAVYFRKKKDGTLRKTVLDLYEKMRAVDRYAEKLRNIAERKPPVWDVADMGTPSSFLSGEGDPAKEELLKATALIADEYARLAASIARRAGALSALAEEFAPRMKEFIGAVAGAAEALAGAGDLFGLCAAARGLTVARSPGRKTSDGPEALHVISQAQALAKQLRELLKELSEGIDAPKEFMRFADAYGRAASLAKLTLMYDEEYTRLKREEGVLDYGDLEHLALAVLQNSEAAEAVRGSYRFIFVDEYQDVNPMQGEILKALTGEELFVVGDKKQAIYGFRGSRTSYFTKMEEACGGALPLDRNFRSAKGVLDAVNAVFAAAMEGYTPMEGGDRYGENRGETLFHTAEKERSERRERAVYSVALAEERVEKSAVAAKVRAIVEEECGLSGRPAKRWFDVETGTMREVGFGDVAVLVRRNTGSAGAVVRALSEGGIPVSSSAGVNICDFFEVRLLIDWLSFLDNGEQDIPLASAMLSAIGGFCESELARIRLAANEMHIFGNFRTAAKRFASDRRFAQDSLAKKVNAFFKRAEELRALARIKSASEMLAILLADGIEAQIAGMGGGKAALSRVRRLMAESSDAGSVHAFLRRIRDANERIMFSESGGEGAVRVLTMHAAKGLEFPVVIAVDLDSAFHRTEHDELMWTEELGPAPRSFDLASKVRYETLTRRAAEICMRREQIEGERNLLYVAMTRAMYRLHLIFETETEGSALENFQYAPDRAKKLSDFIPREKMLSLVAPPAEEAAPEVRREEEGATPISVPEELSAALRPYPHAAATLLPVKSSATGLIRDAEAQETERACHVRDEEEKEDLISDMDAVYSTETGLAYHAFLEHVRFGEDARAELARMREEHILSVEQIALLDEERLCAILAIPRLAGLKDRRVWRERQFLVSLPAARFYGEGAGEEVIFQGAIDLLVEEEGGYTVVDYKFSSRSEEGIRAHYAPQIKLYRKAVAKILHVPEERVGAVIVNIARCEEIAM